MPWNDWGAAEWALFAILTLSTCVLLVLAFARALFPPSTTVQNYCSGCGAAKDGKPIDPHSAWCSDCDPRENRAVEEPISFHGSPQLDDVMRYTTW